MVEWLAGNRIRGTSTERASGDFNNHLTGVGAVGGWKEVGRTTLESVGDFINVSSLPDKRYYMILHDVKPSGNVWTENTFNNDLTGGNTANRRHVDGSADTNPQTSANYIYTSATQSTPMFGIYYIANKSNKEKLQIYHNVMQNTAGSTAPRRYESFSKWANTSDPISTFNLHNGSTGDFDTGSEVVVLGWDEDDTHTTNFWEELASVDLSGGTATSLSSGTFTSKKYLMVQWFCERSGSGDIQPVLQVGTGGSIDNGQNYPMRLSQNGGSEFTSSSYRGYSVWGSSNQRFETMFIINQSNKEKLCISHGAGNNSTGQVDPDRTEYVGKWTNTSGQINIVSLKDQDGITLGNATQMKVWGSD